MMWTDDDDKRLKQLWAEGLTASQIAARMHSTRNAILGRAHRIKLPRRMDGSKHSNRVFSPPPKQWYRNVVSAVKARPPSSGRPAGSDLSKQRLTTFRFRSRAPSFRPDFPTEPLPLPVDDYFVAPENRKRLIDLEPGDCRWPLGDPREADFHFCGGARVPGSSYCPTHWQRSIDARRISSPEVNNAMDKRSNRAA